MSLLKNIRHVVDSRLQPEYLALAASAVTIVTLVLAILQFATAEKGRAFLGTNLGADFSSLFVAAQILEQGHPGQLYDRQLHDRLWHELFPHEAQQSTIPYIHPPFVAGLLRPFTWVPYARAVAIWLVISAMLYIVGLVILLRAYSWPREDQVRLIFLLAVSFEPFAFECWLGGQLSAVAFFSYALCFSALQCARPLLAGMALGICFYKPTLLILVLPLLVVGQLWRVLLGVLISGTTLAALSCAFVGWNNSQSYLQELLHFRQSTDGGNLEIPIWKYVDLNNYWRLLLGTNSPYQYILLGLTTVVPFVWLARLWWRYWQLGDEERELVWAATLAAVPVLNLYVGIYDSILVVQSALITAIVVVRNSQDERALTSSGLAYILLGIYLTPWFSQSLSAATGLSLYTSFLIGLGAYQLSRIAKKATDQRVAMHPDADVTGNG
jgi:hypothetical protein